MIASALLLCIALAFFGDVIFSSKEEVLSKKGTDIFYEYVHTRHFGFNELRQGNLALWNPHVFSGMPFFGGFQPALLYPPNLPYLFLPLPKAINITIVLNLFLSGLFMYLWTSHRRLHPVACLVSAVLFMFCGAHFSHIYAGHLSNLCTMVWVPLILLAVDGWVERRTIGWLLLGMLAVAMQVLAGHPQYVFYTAVTAALYTTLLMIGNKRRLGILIGLVCIYTGGASLSAIQLLTGLQAAGESIRAGGMPYAFAAAFSLPPENLITLLSPSFFGDMESVSYWGRWSLWEMSLFISITGLGLAFFGAARRDRGHGLLFTAMTVILLILALGAYTPLFKVLYSFVPPFDKFRGNSKFIFFASLCLIMLSALGLDHLIKKGGVQRKAIIISIVAAMVLAGAALVIRYFAKGEGQEGVWGGILWAVKETGQSYMSPKTYANPLFIKTSALFSSKTLLISSGTCLLLAAVFWIMRFSKRAVYLLAALAILEILFFARGLWATFDLDSIRVPQIERFVASNRGEHRVLNLVMANTAMSLGEMDIWGSDPGILRRYAEFMTYTQGGNPEKATQNMHIFHFHSLYKMLRCRYVFEREHDKIRLDVAKDAMPRAFLVDTYRLVRNRDDIFAEMERPAFDPRKVVILESPPDPAPVTSKEKGFVTVKDLSTDEMIIEARLPAPAILVITDVYSDGWRANALPGSVEQRYQVMPANYILRAIPLKEGHHRISLKYLPQAFEIGKWVSLLSLILFVCGLGWIARTHR